VDIVNLMLHVELSWFFYRAACNADAV